MPAIGASTTGTGATTRSESRSGAVMGSTRPSPAVLPAGRSTISEPVGKVGLNLIDGDAVLGHAVPIPDRYGVVVKSVEIDRDAIRRADLVLASIPAADRLRVVELHIPAAPERCGQVTRLRRQIGVTRQGQDGGLDRCQPLVQSQYGAFLQLPFRVRCLVFAVGVEQKRQHGSRQTGCRFDHVGRPPLVAFLIEIGEIDAGVFRVRPQVEVRAVRYALEFGEFGATEAEPILDVDRAGRIVGQLVFRMLEEAQIIRVDAEVDPPVPALLQPVVVPFRISAWRDEKLHLHLLELSGPEDEVAGRDLVAETLADLRDSERWLFARGRHDIEEVDENALRGFRPEVVETLLGLDGTEECLEHHVELARRRKATLRPTVRAVDVREAVLRQMAVLGLVGFLEVIGPEAVVAVE